MRILMVSSRYWPYGGGVERHVEGVSIALRSMGHSVDILTFMGSKRLPKTERHNGGTVYRIPGPAGGKSMEVNTGLWCFRHALQLQRYDVIHGHDLVIKTLRSSALRSKYFLTFHGYEGYPVSEESKVRKQKMSSLVQGTLCAGAFIEKWFNLHCDEVEWGAVEAPKADEETIESDICFMGRLTDDSGVMGYVEALGIVLKEKPDLRVMICGAGPLSDRIERTLAGLYSSVKMLSHVDNPHAYIGGTKVVLASGYLSILESMVRRKPVIAYFENPLKQDYLQMAPYAKDMTVTNDVHAIAETIRLILGGEYPKKKIEDAHDIASALTYSALANTYLRLYSKE